MRDNCKGKCESCFSCLVLSPLNLIYFSNKKAGGAKRRRLSGGGRRVLYPALDQELADWIKEKRENKQPVSRLTIRHKATTIFRDTDIKVHFYCFIIFYYFYYLFYYFYCRFYYFLLFFRFPMAGLRNS
jgi:Tc5 transposase DNA-binding domain